jgi:DNA-binding transcriptional LysR family regulator
VETAKYEFIPLAFYDTWGVFMHKNDPLAKKDTISFNDIKDLPLIIPNRRIVTDQIESWFGKNAKKLRVFAYINLITNAMLLIERKLGYGISIHGTYLIRPNKNIHFVPFSPERKSGHVLAWKKNRVFGAAASHFIEYIKNTFKA